MKHQLDCRRQLHKDQKMMTLLFFQIMWDPLTILIYFTLFCGFHIIYNHLVQSESCCCIRNLSHHSWPDSNLLTQIPLIKALYSLCSVHFLSYLNWIDFCSWLTHPLLLTLDLQTHLPCVNRLNNANSCASRYSSKEKWFKIRWLITRH